MEQKPKVTASAPASASTAQVKPYRLLHTHGYVRKIKRMVQLVRNFRGLHTWPRPAPQLKNDASDAAKAARNAYENNRLGVETVHFFAQSVEITHERRDRSKVEAVMDEMSGKNPVNRL